MFDVQLREGIQKRQTAGLLSFLVEHELSRPGTPNH